MKHLSEKFDQLPQEFDREAIWQGIRRPSTGRRAYPVLWGVLVFMASLVVIYMINPFDRARQEEVVSTIATIDPISKNENETDKTISSLTHKPLEGREKDVAVLVSPENTSEYLPETSSPVMFQTNTQFVPSRNSSQNDQDYQNTEEFSTALINATDNPVPAILSPEKNRVLKPFQAISVLEGGLLYNRELELQMGLSSITSLKKKGRHAAAINVGIGRHRSIFTSSDEGAEKWRADLEKAHLDYSLGLRYEYMFRNGWLISASAGYQLFKERINNSFIREQAGEKTLVNYRLDNHHHVVTGQIEAGKRFHHKGFFWDIVGGVGLPLHQVTEADYFISVGKLANEAQVHSDYSSSGNTFFSGQAAIGKYFGSHFFSRAGVQVYSPLELSSSQATIRHRILPARFFLEIGTQF